LSPRIKYFEYGELWYSGQEFNALTGFIILNARSIGKKASNCGSFKLDKVKLKYK
jgi:hypothetical protein